MRTKMLIISLLWFLMPGLLRAQDGIFATTDQQVYITGERVWVSGKVFGSLQHEVAEVLLLDREGRTLMRERTQMSGNIFFTDLQLKGELKSDNYLLCFRVSNRLTHFIPLMIINPVIPPTGNTTPLMNVRDRNYLMRVTPSAQTYAGRQNVEVSVDSSWRGAHYFASVSREDALSLYADSLFSRWQAKDIAIPEAREGMEGKVLDADGEPVEGALAVAAALSDQAELGYGISGKDGRVFIPLPLHYSDLPVAVQVKDGKGLRFMRSEQQDKFDVGNTLPVLVLPARFEADISERLLHTELSNKLKAEGGERFLLENVDTLDLYGRPDKRYMLDNYVRFPDMREVISEFIPEVRIRKLNGQTALQVVNTPYKIFFDQPAMVLLDGVPVTDIDQLLSLDPLKIRSIDVVARKFLLGSLQIPGIVHYKTYRTDMAAFKLPPDVVLYDHKGLKIPSIPVFSSPADSHMPYFRDLLYWQAPTKDRTVFSFPASDAKGLYRIHVVAVDSQGKSFSGTALITVK